MRSSRRRAAGRGSGGRLCVDRGLAGELGLQRCDKAGEMAALALGQHGLARTAGKTDLVLAGPLLGVLDVASAADVDVSSRPDKHVCRGDDVGDGGLPGVVSGDPDGDGDVVGCVSERDREQAVHAEQQEGAPVIERWGGSAGPVQRGRDAL